MQDFGIYDLFFNYQVKWMYAGIEATMKKETGYTCALALSTYTEIMGGLVTGNLKDHRKSKQNYIAFLPYLGRKYVELEETLNKEKLSLYWQVRSKLVHEFSLRESHFIIMSEQPSDDKIGIEAIFDENRIFQLNILITEYYRDFKNGVTKYHDKLKNWRKNQTTLGNFMKAIVVNFNQGQDQKFIPDEES
jgi:hypothetical protein